MSMIWIICGAGKNVGKTTLALQLTELLQGSIYAKCGHGKLDSDKPSKFFNNLSELYSFIDSAKKKYKHVIVESNALAKSSNDGFVIYIDGVAGKTNFRDDTEELKKNSNITICSNSKLYSWKKALSGRITSKKLCEQILSLLLSRKHCFFDTKPVVRSKIWFETDGTHIFGRGLAKLLQNVEHFGTLRDAAKASNMSYRYAWNLIKIAEDNFGSILIYSQAGGRYGGKSKLSPNGLHLLDVFMKLNDQVAAFTDKKFNELYTGKKHNV